MDLEKVFEAVTKATEATTKAIELKGEQTVKAKNEIEIATKLNEIIVKNGNQLDNRLKPASPEVYTSKTAKFGSG